MAEAHSRPQGRVVTLLLNFRTAAMTLAGLDGLRRSTVLDHRVLVMDNGSGAEEEEALRAGCVGASEVDLLLLGQNLGYCAAMNRGLVWAKEQDADYVLFLNSDVTVEEGFLAPLVQVLDHDPRVAGVAPTILREDGRVWAQGGTLGFAPNLNRLREEGRMPADRQSGPIGVDYLPGACVLYRLDPLLAAGGLDERYFMYFEDVLLGDALRRGGHALVWLPWVRVVHDASAASGGGRSPLRKYLSAVNSLRFLREHFRFDLGAAFLLFDCLGLPLAYLGGRRAGWAKTAGIWDGLWRRRITPAVVDRWLQP